MPAPINTYVPAATTDLERLQRAPSNNIADEKKRLRKATQEFESFFMYQMLKAMRKTIPDNALSKGTPLSDGLGKDTFTEMFDLEIARSIKIGGKTSIADLLYNSLEKLVEARLGTDRNAQLSPLVPPEEPAIPLESEDSQRKLPESRQFLPVDRTKRGLPIQVPSVSVKSDPIMGRYGRIIDEAAAANRLDSSMIAAVIQAESAGDRTAVSKAGAKGLMQLTDSTAADLGVVNVFDPKENIHAGSRYLRQMLDQFGDLKLALAAYNAGPGTVAKYDGVPPYDETRGYIDHVTRLMDQKHTQKIGKSLKR